ncbi:MAG TPA: alpha/beta fold hydrolase [Pyrinomonadaceae bacterium]|nr:alpha/beta fold hydrolase [Pyrinomonadaceae bacterium]
MDVSVRDEAKAAPAGGPERPARGAARPQGLRDIAARLQSKPFTPHPLWRGAHAQTIRAAVRWPRRIRMLREYLDAERRLFEVEPGVRLLAHCRWQPRREESPTLLLVHGLEGSATAVYMLGTARTAFRAGFNFVRLNVRNCGGTEHLTPTLYHSGMSDDLRRVIHELVERDGLKSLFLAGFSMGGNLALKLTGELGEEAPEELKGVAAVSPSLDLAACAEAIERRENRLYQWSFVRSLRRHVKRKNRLFPDIYDARDVRRVRTIREYDELYTARHGGFRDAADYYERCSALKFIGRIGVPTLIIHAQDDPFVPFGSFRHPDVASNPNILLLAPERGGHVAFLAGERGEERYWAENRVVDFFRLLADGR